MTDVGAQLIEAYGLFAAIGGVLGFVIVGFHSFRP